MLDRMIPMPRSVSSGWFWNGPFAYVQGRCDATKSRWPCWMRSSSSSVKVSAFGPLRYSRTVYGTRFIPAPFSSFLGGKDHLGAQAARRP